MDDVLVERRDRILIITINRPAARNAIDAVVTRGVAAAMDQLDEGPDLSIGVLTGAGGTFCAGMDLKAFLRGEQVALPGRLMVMIRIRSRRSTSTSSIGSLRFQ
jgi:enoyl-CoA hydratase